MAISSRSHLPPGPRSPRVLQTAVWLVRPIQVFEHCARRYGDPFTLRVLLAGDMIYISDPAAVREVFTGDQCPYSAGKAYSIVEPTGGPQSLLMLDGPQHLRMRKLLSKPLHGDRLRRWQPLIEELTEREIERWPVGRPFPLRPIAESLTLDVIMRIVFGIREPERAAELRRLLPRLFHVSIAQAPSFMMPRLRRDFGRWSPWGRYVRLRARIDELLMEEITRRRAELAHEDEERDDMLSMLLAARDDEGNELTESELRDQLVTMLLAGHETTASSLAWAFERMLRTPHVHARLREEPEGEYLDATIKETLRSRPVVPHVARHLNEDVTLMGRTLPAGAKVAASIHLIHHDPSLYPQPYEFRPERFLEDQPPPYSWIPFGGGVRRCPGSALAMLEMQTVIPAILRRVKLRAARPEPEPIVPLGVTLVPGRGGEVVVEA